MKKLLLIILLSPLISKAQLSIELIANKDNSIFSESSNLSNGIGNGIFAGTTGQGNFRRALIQFPIENLPANIVIDSVLLYLNSDNARSNSSFSIYRLLNNWGEGTSVASGNGGKGGMATINDATWEKTFFNVQNWDTPGGDFNKDSVLCTFTSIQFGQNSFTSSKLLQTVRQWNKGDFNNYGLIIIGNEADTYTAHKFDSRETTTGNPPKLKVFYSLLTKIENTTISNCKIWPTPAQNQIFIPFQEKNLYKVFDVNFKFVQEGISENGVIETDNLQSGIYFLNIENSYYKVVIEK